MKLSTVISHARDRKNLNEIERGYLRVKATGEVFTPLDIITKKLNDLENHDPLLFKDPLKTFLEPSCGDGNFLSEVLIRKLQSLGKKEITDIEFEQALSTIYGTDLMIDNVDLCRERLLCGQEQFRHIVEQNIQCRNALKFGYNFEPMGPARRKTEEDARTKQRNLKAKQEKIAKLEEARKKKEAHQKKLFDEIIPKFI